jgi:hypothetical protein
MTWVGTCNRRRYRSDQASRHRNLGVCKSSCRFLFNCSEGLGQGLAAMGRCRFSVIRASRRLAFEGCLLSCYPEKLSRAEHFHLACAAPLVSTGRRVAVRGLEKMTGLDCIGLPSGHYMGQTTQLLHEGQCDR